MNDFKRYIPPSTVWTEQVHRLGEDFFNLPASESDVWSTAGPVPATTVPPAERSQSKSSMP